MNYSRGQVYYCEKIYANRGGEVDLKKGRPCVIISADRFNENSPNVIVAYITHKLFEQGYPNHAYLTSLLVTEDKSSYVMGEQIATVSKERLRDYVGRVTEEEMQRIDDAVSFSLFSDYPRDNYPAQKIQRNTTNFSDKNEIAKVEYLEHLKKNSQMMENKYNELLKKYNTMKELLKDLL